MGRREGDTLVVDTVGYLRREYVETLRDLLERGDAGTVDLVAAHAAAIGADGLVPQLEQLRTSPNAMVVTVVERALAQLAMPEVASHGS